MTQQGAKSRKTLIAVIALAFVGAAVVATYAVRIEDDRQAEIAMLTVDRGIDQFRQKQYQQSLETLGGISEDVHQEWRINYYMGSSLIMLNDFERAAVQLEKALAMNSEEPNVLYGLGVVYYRLGNLSLSKAYFGRVLDVDPDNDDARGLMDIVANLERQQSAGPEPESEDEAGSGD